MIRLIPGHSLGSPGGSASVFVPGRIVSLKVTGGEGGRWTIISAGKEFSVSSDIPLKRGDILVARVESKGRGLRLRVIETLSPSTHASQIRLDALLREEPALVRAMIRAGLPLREERMKRLRSALGEREGSEREEYARFLSLLEEKGLMFPPLSGFGRFLDEHDGGESGEGSDHVWPGGELNGELVGRILNRSDRRPGKLALFNHTAGRRDSHWLCLPLRIRMEESTYNGEVRLHLSRKEVKILEGTLVLQSEENGEEWIFGIRERESREIYPIRLPQAGMDQIAMFSEKVRKLGFALVDTVSRDTFDGYSLDDPPVSRGIDAQV